MREWSKAQYRDYLASAEWQALSRVIRQRDGYACRLCDRTDTRLQIHHRGYSRIGQVGEMDDCLSLCPHCHKLVHEVVLA